MSAPRKYFDEHIAFIRENISGRTFADLTEMFNGRYGYSISVNAMVRIAAKHGLHNGRSTKFAKGHREHPETQFKKGLVPHNKGKKGVFLGGEKAIAAQFPPGHKPWNYKPVGSERIADGYLQVKVADPGTWKGKHILIWEDAHGPVPKEHVVIFADGNRRNYELENLLLVSRRQLAVMNHQRLIKSDTDLTKVGVVIADLYLKISDRRKCIGGNRRGQ